MLRGGGGMQAQASGIAVSKSGRVFTIFSTSSDHFHTDVGIPVTCGCVLVDHGLIRVIIRAD